MFYVAYFKSDKQGRAQRPVTFLFNGGAGLFDGVAAHGSVSAPKRVVTLDDSHTPAAAPYPIINNDYKPAGCERTWYFVDAPGTGFSRISGKDREKGVLTASIRMRRRLPISSRNFWGNTADGMRRKYMFGESYGTTRSGGALSRVLETERERGTSTA